MGELYDLVLQHLKAHGDTDEANLGYFFSQGHHTDFELFCISALFGILSNFPYDFHFDS